MNANRPGNTPTAAACCAHCRHWLADRAALEQRMAEMRSFGSSYSAVIAASRLCTLHDCWAAPEDTCARFKSGD
jgi:uncharacterized membrane protein